MLSRFSASIENEPAFTCPTKPKSMLAASTMLWIVILFYYDFPRDARFSFIKRHKTLFFFCSFPTTSYHNLLLLQFDCPCRTYTRSLTHSKAPRFFAIKNVSLINNPVFVFLSPVSEHTQKKSYECIPSPTHNWVKCVTVSRLISIGLKINSDKVSKFLFNQLTNAKPTTVQRLTRWWWIRHFWSTQPKNNTNEISIEAGPGHCFRDQSTKL